MIGPEIEMGEQTGPGNEHKTIFVSSAALLGQGIVLLPLQVSKKPQAVITRL